MDTAYDVILHLLFLVFTGIGFLYYHMTEYIIIGNGCVMCHFIQIIKLA